MAGDQLRGAHHDALAVELGPIVAVGADADRGRRLDSRRARRERCGPSETVTQFQRPRHHRPSSTPGVGSLRVARGSRWRRTHPEEQWSRKLLRPRCCVSIGSEECRRSMRDRPVTLFPSLTTRSGPKAAFERRNRRDTLQRHREIVRDADGRPLGQVLEFGGIDSCDRTSPGRRPSTAPRTGECSACIGDGVVWDGPPRSARGRGLHAGARARRMLRAWSRRFMPTGDVATAAAGRVRGGRARRRRRAGCIGSRPARQFFAMG